MINFIWIGSHLPDWAKRNIDEFAKLNPDHEIVIHGEEVLLSEYKSIYNKIRYLESKSDLLRYSALKRQVGWYFDVDFWPLRPIQDIVNRYNITDETFLLTKQQWNNPSLPIANAVLFANPDNRAWRSIDEKILSIPPKFHTSYGPSLFNKVIRLYPELFTIGDADMFYPFNKKDAKKIYKSGDFTAIPNNPFMIHLWAGGKTEL